MQRWKHPTSLFRHKILFVHSDYQHRRVSALAIFFKSRAPDGDLQRLIFSAHSLERASDDAIRASETDGADVLQLRPIVAAAAGLRAATCACHLCWKPRTAVLSGSVGASSPGVFWRALEHVMSIWPEQPPTLPLLPSPLSAMWSARCQGQRINMHERTRTISEERLPNVNGKGHRGENMPGIHSGPVWADFILSCNSLLNANLWNLVCKCRGVLWGLQWLMHLLAAA